MSLRDKHIRTAILVLEATLKEETAFDTNLMIAARDGLQTELDRRKKFWTNKKKGWRKYKRVKA